MAFIAQTFNNSVFAALEIQPGVSAGLTYTNNARKTADNTIDDLIVDATVGMSLAENQGPLTYQIATSLNKQSYVNNTFADQQNFNLSAVANWVMIQNRFNWMMSNHFNQSTIASLAPDTPDNRQDTNVFTLSADINSQIASRQHLSIVPSFSQFYYEKQRTDNKQYSLTTNWQYQATRLTNTGLSIAARKIDYTETDLLGNSIEDIRFLTTAVTFAGQRVRSTFDGMLGATYVKRDNGQKTSGFAGHLNWLTDISARSIFSVLISTDLTDTSTVGVDAADGTGVQITTDVIRSSNIDLAYLRKDDLLDTRISTHYHKIKHIDNTRNNRTILGFTLQLGYPLTQQLTASAYASHNRTKLPDTGREDKSFAVGTGLRYFFSDKMHGAFDLKYQEQKSTNARNSFDEFSAYLSLVYGLGAL